MSEEHVKTVRRLTETFETLDFSQWDDFVAPDAVFHNMPPGYPADRAGLERLARDLQAGAPDARTTIEDVFAAGDKVCARLRSRGTHTGELFGIPPTNRTVDVEGIEIYRFDGGEVAEYWSQWDMAGLMGQLGVIPAQG